MRQMVFANDDFDINAEVLFVSDNLEYASARLLCRGWPVGDLNIDDDVFEIAPVAAAGGFFTENAVFGSRATCVVGRARKAGRKLGVVGRAQFFFLRRATHDARRFRIFHSMRNYDLLVNVVFQRGGLTSSRL